MLFGSAVISLVIFDDCDTHDVQFGNDLNVQISRIPRPESSSSLAAFAEAIDSIQADYYVFSSAALLPFDDRWLHSACSILATDQSAIVGSSGYSAIELNGDKLLAMCPINSEQLNVAKQVESKSAAPFYAVLLSLSQFAFSDCDKAEFCRAAALLNDVPTDDLSFSLQLSLISLLRPAIVANHLPDNSDLMEEQVELDFNYDYLMSCFPIDSTGLAIWIHNLNECQKAYPSLFSGLQSPHRRGLIRSITHLDEDRFEVETPDGTKLIDDSSRFMGSGTNSYRSVLLGCGTGERVNKHLDRSNPSELIVIEPELDLLRAAFVKYAWGEFIRDGRLTFITPALDNSHFIEISLREVGAKLLRAPIIEDAPVAWVVTGSTQLNKAFFDSVQMLVDNNYGNRAKLLKLHRPRKFHYDVTVVSPNCAIFHDLAKAFHELGLNTRLLVVSDVIYPQNFNENWDAVRNLMEQPSKLTVFRNRALLESLGNGELLGVERFLPGQLCSWWWDVPNVASVVDYNAPQNAPPALGFAKNLFPLLPHGSGWLPAGARTQFTELKAARYAPDIPVSFVGQCRVSLIINNLNTIVTVLKKYDEHFAMYLQQIANSARDMGVLYTNLLAISSEVCSRFNRFSAGRKFQFYYLNYLWEMVVTAAFRIAVIFSLKDTVHPVQVFGDESWVKCGAVRPENFHGVVPQEKLGVLYQRTKVNLNLNFMQVSSTVNPKVLDIAAAGAMVLTDYRPELEVLYPDEGLRPSCCDNVEQFAEKINSWLSKPDLDALLSCQNYTRQHHSMQNRASEIARLFDLADVSVSADKTVSGS